MKTCEVERNLKRCNCTWEPCSKKGVCCDCVQYHRIRGELPACFFPDDVEAGFDRSYECFARTLAERGRWW